MTHKLSPSQAIAATGAPVRLLVLVALLCAVLAVNVFFAPSPGDGGSGIGGTGRFGGESGLGGTGGPAFKLGALDEQYEEREAPAADAPARREDLAQPEQTPFRVAVEDLRLTPEPGHIAARPLYQPAVTPREELDRNLARMAGESRDRDIDAVQADLLRETMRDPVDTLDFERGLDNQLARDKDHAARAVLVSTLEITRELILAEADTGIMELPENIQPVSEERVRFNLPPRPERPDRPNVPSRRFSPPQRDIPSPPVRPMRI